MAAAPPSPSRKRRRAGVWLGAVALLLLALLGGIAWWSGSEGSLAQALWMAQHLLPGDQRLLYSNARGSLAGGGRVGRLQWSKPGVTLTVEDLVLDWSLRELLGRDLRVRTLSARNVHVRLAPTQSEDKPFVMPAEVTLPVRVTVPLAIAVLEIEAAGDNGPATANFQEISAQYRYDGTRHTLRLASLRYGQSYATADAQLHARSLDLSGQVGLSLRDLVSNVPFALLARLQFGGTLAGGEAAQLRLQLDASQQPRDAPPPAVADLPGLLAALPTAPETAGAQIHALTAIHPWRQQPAQQLDLQISGLDAHAFHASAPVTDLSGTATVTPADAEATWNAAMQFSNAAPGAWDRQRLPLRGLTGSAELSAAAIDIQSAQAELGGSAAAGELVLAGRISLSRLPDSALRLDARQVDLRGLIASWPRTALNGAASIAPDAQQGSMIQADIRNTMPGRLDQQRVPFDSVLAKVSVAPDQLRIDEVSMQVGAGVVDVHGSFTPAARALDLRVEVQGVPLRQIHRKMAAAAASVISGSVTLGGNLQQGLAFDADMASSAGATGVRGEWEIRSLQARGRWSPRRLNIERIHLDALQARADGRDIDVTLPGLDSVKAVLEATAPGVQLSTEAAMQRQSGGGKLALRLTSAEQMVRWLRGLPLVADRLDGLRATGAAFLEAEWQGGWRQWISAWRNPAAQQRLSLDATAQTDGLHFDMPIAGRTAPLRIDVQRLALDVHGNLAAATLAINGEGSADEARAALDVRMRATPVASAGAPRWNIGMEKFDVAATLRDQPQPWRLQLSDDLQLTMQIGADVELRASAGTATLSAPAGSGSNTPLQLAWQPVQWRRTANGAMTLQGSGTAAGIQPGWMDLLADEGKRPLASRGMRTDLVLSGDWSVQMTDVVNIRAHVKREAGDLWLTEAETSAGARNLDITVQAMDANVNAIVDWDSQRAGVVSARVGTRLTRTDGGWRLPPEAPLSGTIQMRMQDLSPWTFLVPPGWRIQGALEADVRLGGTLGAPQMEGGLAARGINIRSVLDGVDLNNGSMRAAFTGSRMEIDELIFQGGTGSRAYVRGFSGNLTPPPSARGRMVASGTIDWSGVSTAGDTRTGIAMDLRAQLQSMQVLVRHDRQMTLSGELSATLRQGALRIGGDLKVDRASIVLPEASAPTLGDDVTIVRNSDLANPGKVEARARGQLKTRKPLDMEIKLDLGRDLALEGQGITTRLEGELTVRSNPVGTQPFSVFGEVRTDEGRYRAWGQALNVETGVFRFNGSYSNPSLDLLAIRPNIDVRAGVRVTGTLQAPRAQLYSDPDLPEGEKLSWVVLGRPTIVAGAEGTSMQQAALGLAAGQLGGRLASGLGLDELGLGQSGVSLGKRITNELYLTYEAGLSGAASTLYIFYDITRRLTLRAETGEASALDLVYTITYD